MKVKIIEKQSIYIFFKILLLKLKNNNINIKRNSNIRFYYTMSKTGTSKKSISDSIKCGDFNIDQNDLFLIGDSELDNKGLVYHHISSADDLYEIGIPQIITQVFIQHQVEVLLLQQ